MTPSKCLRLVVVLPCDWQLFIDKKLMATMRSRPFLNDNQA